MYRAEGLDYSPSGHWNLEGVLAITLLVDEHYMHCPTFFTQVWMYRAEGLDFNLAGHCNLEGVSAITLLVVEHHMHGPTLPTHV
jgi:hypothetical protein